MYTLRSIAVAAALVAAYTGSAAATCVESGGNWYCNEVEQVTYLNLGKPASYNRVTGMSGTTGVCNTSSYSYSGVNAPYNEELSFHFRGPLALKQFAFYLPSSSSPSKRSEHRHEHNGRDHAHLHQGGLEKRLITPSPSCPSWNGAVYTSGSSKYTVECNTDHVGGDIGSPTSVSSFAACMDSCATTAGCVGVVFMRGYPSSSCFRKSSLGTATPNYRAWGAQLVSSSPSSSALSSSTASSSTSAASSVKTSSSVATTLSSSVKASSSVATTLSSIVQSSSTSAAPSATSTSTSASSRVTSTSTSAAPSATSTSTSAASSAASSAAPSATSTSATSWTRRVYYNSASGTSNGLTFLNSEGGAPGSGVWDSHFGSSLSYATSSGTGNSLNPTVLADTTLPSSAEVVIFTSTSCSDGLCGYYRPGSVAYHGFSGASKLFLIEFGMPLNTAGGNAPAIWALNALIPRTQQYGGCNCWGNTQGCGEIDLFETLTAGETRLISSFHGTQATTDPDYFVRPTSGTMKAAIIMTPGQLVIKVLSDSFSFDAALTDAQIAGLSALGTNLKVAGGNVSTVTLS